MTLGEFDGSPEQDLLEEEAVFVVAGVEVDPAQRGYTAVHNYALYFWRPYLGNTAFALWELLLSFCYGDRDTAYPSIARLARMITNSDHSRAVVTGRRRPLKTLEVLETSKVSTNGALPILRRERLVQVGRQGTGRMSRYTFRVLKALPLLRPEQVARLSPGLQLDHALWLERHGITPAAYLHAYAPPDQPAQSVPCAPGASPCAASIRADAAGTGPCAPGGTNNTQEQPPWKHWWRDTLSELRLQLTRSAFETCLLHTQVSSFEDGVLTLQSANSMVRDSLQHRLAPLIERTLQDTSQAQVREVVYE